MLTQRHITVRVMRREYTLLVEDSHESEMREIAGFVDARMREFQRSHPEQSELTTAIICALSIAEELYASRGAVENSEKKIDDALDQLDARLEKALAEQPAPPARNGRKK